MGLYQFPFLACYSYTSLCDILFGTESFVQNNLITAILFVLLFHNIVLIIIDRPIHKIIILI